MTKIFSADYRNGTFIDSVNKIVGVPTSLSKLIRTEKGTALAGVVNHDGVTYTTGSKSLSKFTIIAWIKQRTTDTGEKYTIVNIGNAQIIRRVLSSTNYDNFLNSSVIGSISIPITTSLNKWMQFVVTYDGVNVVSSVNNKQIVGSPAATTDTLDFTSIIVGRGTGTTRYSDSDILKFDVYDDVISDKEIGLDYKALLDTQITEKPVRGFELVKPTDLSYLKDTGLVAAYNMIPNGNTLVDISGNGNNGTIVGALRTKDGMSFDGLDDKVTFSTINLGNVWTVATRFSNYTKGSSTDLLLGNISGVNNSLMLKSATSSVLSYRSTTAYDFVTTNASLENKEVDLIFVSNGTTISLYINGLFIESITPDTTTISNMTSLFGTNVVNTYLKNINKDLKIYNYAFTPEQAKAYHNYWVKPVILEDFSNNGVNNTEIKDWQKVSGDFVIKELSADDTVLKHLTTGTKYLECVTVGKIAIPNTQAYGTWEWDWNKSASTTNFILPVSDRVNAAFNAANGYTLATIMTGVPNLIKSSVGTYSNLNFTATSYAPNLIWYSYKLTRSSIGQFHIYIKGGSFGNTWTLVSTTGGSGTNPVTDNTYTTSNYFVAVLNPGDKIANIKFYDGIKQ